MVFPVDSDTSIERLARDVALGSVASGLFKTADRRVQLGRYRLNRKLGSGGMGMVFEAFDTDASRLVALKVLRKPGAAGLARLKREFRALAGIHHPNLIRLYELQTDTPLPFLSMELVHGDRIDDFVRPEGVLDLVRFDSALRQLADAVATLHTHRVLHRDIKPSNILVDKAGRLVVLDFGLARSIEDAKAGTASGTLLYCAPERVLGAVESEASDWYSVGVVACELLRGSLAVADWVPAPAPAAEIQAALAEAPAPWGNLCERFLAYAPQQRPDHVQIRVELGLPPLPAGSSPLRPPSTPMRIFGRKRELDALLAAVSESADGAFGIALVHGEPGIGKTALVRGVAGELEASTSVTLLMGRCYERELIPYNAIDGLVDALVPQLARMRSGLERLDGAAELAHMFPALTALLPSTEPTFGRVLSETPSDLHRIRVRGFLALRAILSELAAQQPLVIVLDDLQWGDSDSANALRELFEPPISAPVLLIATYRSADAQASCVQTLESLCRIDGCHRGTLLLEPLSDSSALELARAVSGPDTSESQLVSACEEAHGNPLLLRALLQSHAQRGERVGSVTIGALIGAMHRDLTESGREVLELTALAGRPLRRDSLFRAARRSQAPAVWVDALDHLERLALIRAVPAVDGTSVETYHDRVRETVVTSLSPSRKRELHNSLAEVEAELPSPDHEFLAYQFVGAEKPTRAAYYAELAGDRAFSTAALERAVILYKLAVKCHDLDASQALLTKLARATAYTGRCARAAPIYLRAARREAGAPSSLELRLRAAEMLLRSGQPRRAELVAHSLLRALNLRLPRSSAAARLSALRDLLRLKLNGPEVVQSHRLEIPRRRADSDRAEALRTELCFAFGYRLSMIEPARGCALLLRSILRARDGASRPQHARALACYAFVASTLSVEPAHQQDAFFDRAWDLAANTGEDEAECKGWILYFRGMAEFTRGDFQRALDTIARAKNWFTAHSYDYGWLHAEAEVGLCVNWLALGELGNLAHAAESAHQLLERTGNRFQTDCLSAMRTQVWIARNNPDRALLVLQGLATRWQALSPGMLVAWCQINALMYIHDEASAWHLILERWPRFTRAGLRRVHHWKISMTQVEATVALACLQRRPNEARYLRVIRTAIKRLERIRTPWAEPVRALIQAGLAQHLRDSDESKRHYERAVVGFEAVSMRGYAQVARLRLAEVSTAESAVQGRTAALMWIRAQGIERPMTWARMYAPVTSLRDEAA